MNSLSLIVLDYKSDVMEKMVEKSGRSLSDLYDYEILIIDEQSQENYWDILQKKERSKVG